MKSISCRNRVHRALGSKRWITTLLLSALSQVQDVIPRCADPVEPVEPVKSPSALEEMARAAMSVPPSSLTCLRRSRLSSSLLFFLLSCSLLLSCPGSVDAGSSEKNCSASGDPCQEGGSLLLLTLLVTDCVTFSFNQPVALISGDTLSIMAGTQFHSKSSVQTWTTWTEPTSKRALKSLNVKFRSGCRLFRAVGADGSKIFSVSVQFRLSGQQIEKCLEQIFWSPYLSLREKISKHDFSQELVS